MPVSVLRMNGSMERSIVSMATWPSGIDSVASDRRTVRSFEMIGSWNTLRSMGCQVAFSAFYHVHQQLVLFQPCLAAQKQAVVCVVLWNAWLIDSYMSIVWDHMLLFKVRWRDNFVPFPPYFWSIPWSSSAMLVAQSTSTGHMLLFKVKDNLVPP